MESPRFDQECVVSKRLNRLLEGQFKRDPSNKEKSLHSLLDPTIDTNSAITPDDLLDPTGFTTSLTVSPAEVDKLIKDSFSEQCELDSMPTWLPKSLHSIFAPNLALLLNIFLSQAHLPDTHKRAIIRPRLKKPGLDLSDPASFRTISNLSFILNLVECVVHRQVR